MANFLADVPSNLHASNTLNNEKFVSVTFNFYEKCLGELNQIRLGAKNFPCELVIDNDPIKDFCMGIAFIKEKLEAAGYKIDITNKDFKEESPFTGRDSGYWNVSKRVLVINPKDKYSKL